jgi:hypothetical protein
MWLTALQIGELVETAQQVSYDSREVNLQLICRPKTRLKPESLSRQRPCRDGGSWTRLLSPLGLILRSLPGFTVS